MQLCALFSPSVSKLWRVTKWIEREGNVLLLSCINNIGPSLLQQRLNTDPPRSTVNWELQKHTFFSPASYLLRDLKSIISGSLTSWGLWKTIFFFFRRKGIKTGTFPWGPSSVILKHKPHKYVRQGKAKQRVFSQTFTVTQVKISNYVLERGHQNQRCKQQPEIKRLYQNGLVSCSPWGMRSGFRVNNPKAHSTTKKLSRTVLGMT